MAERRSSDHGLHDLELVAAYAAHDVAGDDLERAQALVASCDACSLLASDLRALATATRTDAAFTARAPRDLRIPPTVAARIRRPSVAQRLRFALASITAARRPLGAAVAAIGLAGIVVFGVPFGPFGGAASAGANYDTSNPAMQPAPGKAYGPESTTASGEGASVASPPASSSPGVPVYRADTSPSPGTTGADAGGAPATALPVTTPTGSNAGDLRGGEHGTGSLGPGQPLRSAAGLLSILLLVVGSGLALVPRGGRRRS